MSQHHQGRWGVGRWLADPELGEAVSLLCRPDLSVMGSDPAPPVLSFKVKGECKPHSSPVPLTQRDFL